MIKIKAPKENPAITPSQIQEKRAKSSKIIKIKPDSKLVDVYESMYSNDMFVIRTLDDIPKNLPEDIYDQIVKYFKETDFEKSLKDIAVLNPFMGELRGFLLEIFEEDKGTDYIEEMIKTVPQLKVHNYKHSIISNNKPSIHFLF